MPLPRKVDLLPEKLRAWLQDELKARGFAGYVDLADALNVRLEDEGLELRIGKSALHEYGQEYAEFVKLQEASSTWTSTWMNENGLQDQVQRHDVLFQMITTLAFKTMKDQFALEEGIKAQDLHFLGRMLKDLMGASGIKEKLIADAEERGAARARKEAATAIETNARQLGLSAETVAGIKAKILGVEK